MNRILLSVGYDKKGEDDFAISGEIMNLTHEQMNKFRQMIIVSIGTLEDMWRREQERKNPSSKNNKQTQ